MRVVPLAGGEILLTAATAAGSALDTSRLERRELVLKGKSESTEIFVLTTTLRTDRQPMG